MTAVGTRAERGDGSSKVRGTAAYTADVALPGMLHGRLLRSPVARGRIRRLDTSRAAALDGVWAIVTAADAPGRFGQAVGDEAILASERVAYEGEPIAAVAAGSAAIAARALAAIELEIDEETPVVDVDAAMREDSPLVHPDWESFRAVGPASFRHGNVCAEMTSDPGGVDEAFAQAGLVVEDEYRAPRQYQAYLEPRGVLAVYDSGRYTVHISHQFPFRVRDRLAEALGVPTSAVRVVGHHIGGGFGAKLDLTIEPYAALLARATGRPVRIVLGRTEDMITCQCREDAIIRVRTAVAADGTLLARDLDVLLDAGAAATDAPYLVSIPLILAGAPYQVGPTRVRCRAVYTNTAPTGAFRGVSGTHVVFALERHMDRIATELGADRRTFRLERLVSDGHALLNGQRLPDASVFREAFAAIEERAPWASLGREPFTGVGIAACVWLTNPKPGSVLTKLGEDGTLAIVTAATENGSGAVSMGITQIAADQLSIEPGQVVVSMPDTDAAPFDAGSQGSRTTHVVGRAIANAGEELRRQVLDIASSMLEADPEDLELADGQVGVRGARRSRIALAEVATEATARGRSIAAAGTYATPQPDYDPTCASGLLMPTFPTPTYHVHLAEVRVDPVTGIVTILRYVVAQEVGRTVNPVGAEGQVQGGVTQGIGYALWENLSIGEDGRFRQRTLESYRLPVAPDVPRVETILLEHPDARGPFGAKGVAEPPIVPVGAAIANAVADAVGAPIDELPISAAAVLEALETAGPPLRRG